MKHHPTARVERMGSALDIDELIAPLLRDMWKAGIDTFDSCQGNPEGWVRIAFPSDHDLKRFLDAAAPPALGRANVHDRAETCQRRWTRNLRRRWRYTVSVIDEDSPCCQECRASQTRARFNVWIVLRFPVEDLPAVHRNVEAFLSAAPGKRRSLRIGASSRATRFRDGSGQCRRMEFARALFEYVFRFGPGDFEFVSSRGAAHGGMLRRPLWPSGTWALLYLPENQPCCYVPEDLVMSADLLGRARAVCEPIPDDEGVLVRLEGVDADSMDFSADIGDRAIALLTGVRARPAVDDCLAT